MSGLAGILGLHDLMALENWLSYSYRDDYASEGAGRGSVEFSCSGGQVAVFCCLRGWTMQLSLRTGSFLSFLDSPLYAPSPACLTL